MSRGSYDFRQATNPTSMSSSEKWGHQYLLCRAVIRINGMVHSQNIHKRCPTNAQSLSSYPLFLSSWSLLVSPHSGGIRRTSLAFYPSSP